jgi:hypothetical protein
MVLVASATLVLLPARARGDDAARPTVATEGDEISASDATVSPGLRVGAVGAALVPGILLHGSGHFVLGRRATALKLFAMQGVGMTMLLLAGLPLVLTGASRYLTRSASTVAILGVATFGTAFQADLFGSVVPLSARGIPERVPAAIEAEVGYRYVHDPRFRYTSFAAQGLDVRYSSVRLSPSALVALDDENRRLRLEGAYRFFGPRFAERPARDGSFLELELATTHHRYASEGFATLVLETVANGRLDLERFDPWLRGTFAEAHLGMGLQLYDYDGLPLGSDRESLLLAGMGFGLYFGGPEPPFGEVVSYYDHRHDDLAGGFTEAAIGIAGHAGLSGKIYLTDYLGLAAFVEGGAAFVGGASLLVRSAGER